MFGKSAHRLPESVLSSGPGAVLQSATKEYVGVLASLSNSTGSESSFAQRDSTATQTHEASPSSRCCGFDCRVAAPTSVAGRCGPHPDQIALDAGPGEPTAATH